MKTQIIQLEPHDDVISTRDKMGWGQTGRVVLALPKGAAILNRRLDLVLLQRHAASLGAQLALVSGDEVVRYYAKELRIAVFNNTKDAQRLPWRTGRRRRLRIRRPGTRPDLRELRAEITRRPPAWSKHPAFRLGFFGLGVLSFVAVILYLLPGARIELVPKAGLQETNLVVQAGPQIEAVTLVGKLPARWETVIVEGRSSTPVSGKTFVPKDTATGFVRFTNLTDHSVQVDRGVIVMTEADDPAERVLFSTTQSGRVPAGAGSSIVLGVKALSPGKSGNLLPNQITAIEGPLGLELAVVNAVAASGGTDIQAAAPSARDTQILRDELAATLKSTALDELADSLGPGDYPITSTLAMSSTLEETFLPDLTEGAPYPPAEELALTLRLEFKVLVVSGTDLQALGSRVLDASLEDRSRAVAGTLEIDHLTQPALLPGGEYRWRIHVQRVVEALINPQTAQELAAGRSPEEAGAALQDSLALGEPPRITPIPAWWPILPALPMRIEIEVMAGQ